MPTVRYLSYVHSKTEILEELPKLTKDGAPRNLLDMVELDGDDWLDTEEPLTV